MVLVDPCDRNIGRTVLNLKKLPVLGIKKSIIAYRASDVLTKTKITKVEDSKGFFYWDTKGEEN